MKKDIQYWFVLIIFLVGFYAYAEAQPSNDVCTGPVEISDGNWYAGNNTNAICEITDHRTSNCTTPQQTSNVCCGIEGIESSVWYNFTVASSGTVYVDFRNISCNPISFFGTTTALQGFVLRRPFCTDPTQDTTKACFNASTVSDVNGQMSFTALAGQPYYIQIDTKKNSFGSCNNCGPGSPTCHSTCNWEIRIRTSGALPVPDVEMNLISSDDGVKIKWTTKTNYVNYKIERVDISNLSSSIVTENISVYFQKQANEYEYIDTGLLKNGVYIYSLYGLSPDGYYELLSKREIQLDASGEPAVSIYPNPAFSQCYMLIRNLKEDAVYSIYNSLGENIQKGIYSEKNNGALPIDVSKWPSDIYSVVVNENGKVFTRKLAVISK